MGTPIAIMEYDGVETAAEYSARTTVGNIDGISAQRKQADYTFTTPSHSPQAGIGYIDQAADGFAGRGDVFAAGTDGLIGARRLQRFSGAFIGMSRIAGTRIQGRVGASNYSAENAARAVSAQSTAVPDDNAVTAAFTNPAMLRAVKRLKRRK